MKLVWHSNSPMTTSGYGIQTALFTPRIAEHVESLTLSAFRYTGVPFEFNGLNVLPGFLDAHGNDILPWHAEQVFGKAKDGVVLGLHDIWVIRPPVLKQLNFASWCPVDHDPPHPAIAETLKTGDVLPIAMSRFGEERLSEAGLDPLYVPHGVDTSLYRPLDRTKCREMFGFTKEQFVVGVVGANAGRSPNRKAFPEIMEGFAKFHRTHPEAVLALHTELTGASEKRMEGGIDLIELAAKLDLPAEAVWAAPQYNVITSSFPSEYMVQFYNAMDVLLMPSYGEGFGIPLIEAQSCGTPVITNNWTSMPELCGSGWLTEGSRFWTPFGSWQSRPDTESIYDCLAKACKSGKRERDNAREFALAYDADLITEDYWVPALKQIGEHFGQ